jgi:hypothetical protein
MKQVIHIDPFGRPASLRMPDGVGFDLRRFGVVSMHRISDILLDEDSQLYYVQFPDGSRLTNTTTAITPRIKSFDLFESYEKAVEAEVEFYNQDVKRCKK